MSIDVFKVHIMDEELVDLKERIRNTRWPMEFDRKDWEFGTNLEYLKNLCNYWQNEFDWRKTENKINNLPNFITIIDGFKIHFIHIKGQGKNSIPIILTHGWPSSFLEFLKIIPLLNSNGNFSFDLVIPSLIGYGFSQNSNMEGVTPFLIADLWFKLMNKLGYERFGAHGGDFGADVSIALGLKYSKNLIGIHLTGADYYIPFVSKDSKLTQSEISFEEKSASWVEKNGAYAHLHRTKPITISYSMDDSPIGLCSWILEKFYNWSDCKGNLDNVLTKEEILSNITLYWITRTFYSSIQLYKEFSNSPIRFSQDDFITCPVAFAHFPVEEPFPPEERIKRGFNLKQWTEMPKGGHFASLEQPELLANDIIHFFKNFGNI